MHNQYNFDNAQKYKSGLFYTEGNNDENVVEHEDDEDACGICGYDCYI